MSDDPSRAPWYFGVFCERCGSFIPVRRDDSGGRPGVKVAASGTIIASCQACGHRGRYAVNRVEQRRAEPKAPVPGEGRG